MLVKLLKYGSHSFKAERKRLYCTPKLAIDSVARYLITPSPRKSLFWQSVRTIASIRIYDKNVFCRISTDPASKNTLFSTLLLFITQQLV